MYWGNGMGGWGMVLMTVSSLLFWGLVIAGIVALVRYAGRSGQASTSAANSSVDVGTPSATSPTTPIASTMASKPGAGVS